MIAKFSLILFFFFYSIASFGQSSCDCFIEGIVRDRITKDPIVGAIVQIPGIQRVAITDATGRYKIDNLCQGRYEVMAEIVGYKPILTSINLQHKGVHEFELAEEEIHLEQVNIYAEKVENSTLAKEKLEGVALYRQMGGMLGEVIRKTPGVNMLQTGHSISKPIINGLHSNRVLILNHGVRQEGQQWGSEHAPEIDPFLAKRITIISGAGGLRYGSDALGGTILVEPGTLRIGDPLRLEWQQTYFTNGNQLAGAFRLEHGSKRWSNWRFRWQASGKRGGDISTPEYRLANTGLSEVNFSTTAFFKKREWEYELFFSQYNARIGIFSGAHIGNVSDLLSAIRSDRPQEIYTPTSFSWTIGRPQQNLQHNLWKNQIKWRNWSLDVSRQYNFRQEIDILRGDRNLSQTFRLTTYLTDLHYRQSFRVGHEGEWGIQTNTQLNVSTGELRSPQRSTVIIPNFSQFLGALYTTHAIRGEKTSWEWGGRWDWRSTQTFALSRGNEPESSWFRFSNLALNAGFSKIVGKGSQWSLSLTRSWRPPSVNELLSDGVHHGAASFEVGDASLQPEVSHQMVSKWSWQANPRIETNLTAYVQWIQNYIFMVPSGEAVVGIRGAFPAFLYTQTDAFFRGINWQGEWKFRPRFQYSWQASLVLADDLSRRQPLPFISPPEYRHQIAWVFPKLFVTWEVEHQWVARQSRLPGQIDVSEVSLGIPIPLIQGDFAPAPASFQLWNTSLQYQREDKPWSFQFEVRNLFQTRYRAYLDRFRYFTDAPGRNFQFRVRYAWEKK